MAGVESFLGYLCAKNRLWESFFEEISARLWLFSVYAEKVDVKTAKKPEKCGPERKFLCMDTFKFQNEVKKPESGIFIK